MCKYRSGDRDRLLTLYPLLDHGRLWGWHRCWCDDRGRKRCGTARFDASIAAAGLVLIEGAEARFGRWWGKRWSWLWSCDRRSRSGTAECAEDLFDRQQAAEMDQL